jgi:biotin operon repressor
VQHKELCCGRFVSLERGQLALNTVEFAKEIGLSRQSVRTAILHLVQDGALEIYSNHGFSIVTILNYSQYQDTLTTEQPLSNHRATTEQPLSNHRTSESPINSSTSKALRREEGKKGRRKKEESVTSDLRPDSLTAEPILTNADLVIDAWLTLSREHGGRPVDSAKVRAGRRVRVNARLKEGHSVEDLIEAARGAWLDPWCVERGLTQIENIFRNAGNVASYRARACTPKASATPIQDAKKQARIDELRRSFRGMEDQAKQMGIDLDMDPLEQEVCR